MRFFWAACASTLVLAGCAETFLTTAESPGALTKISASRTHQDVETLKESSQRAAALAYSYLNAANNVTTVQEVSAGVAIVAAGATAHGAVTGASSTALANRAIPGIAATIVAARYASQNSIQAIYAGAQRLNCISGQAGIAHGVGSLRSQEHAAVAATRAAMLDAQIKTRTELVRENPAYSDFLGAFTEGIGQTVSEGTRAQQSTELTKYIERLAACVAIEPSKAPSGSGGQGNGNNPDEPSPKPDANQTPQKNDVLVEN